MSTTGSPSACGIVVLVNGHHIHVVVRHHLALSSPEGSSRHLLSSFPWRWLRLHPQGRSQGEYRSASPTTNEKEALMKSFPLRRHGYAITNSTRPHPVRITTGVKIVKCFAAQEIFAEKTADGKIGPLLILMCRIITWTRMYNHNLVLPQHLHVVRIVFSSF